MESAIQNSLTRSCASPAPNARVRVYLPASPPRAARATQHDMHVCYMSRREPAACASPPPPLFASPPPAAPATAATLNALRFAAAAALRAHHRRSRGRSGRWGTQAERQGCAPLHLRHLRVRLVELRRDQARRRRCVRDAGGAGHRPDADGFGRASAGMRLCGRLSWRAVQREAGADRRGAAPAHRASGVHSRQARCAARCAARGAVYQLEPDPREITESRRSRRSRRSRQMEEREKMEERQIEWRSKGDRTTCRRRRRALAKVKRGHARRRAVRRYRLLEAAAADPL